MNAIKQKAREEQKRRARKANLKHKEQRKKERKCFWEPPFGHIYESNKLGSGRFFKCVSCGRVR